MINKEVETEAEGHRSGCLKEEIEEEEVETEAEGDWSGCLKDVIDEEVKTS